MKTTYTFGAAALLLVLVVSAVLCAISPVRIEADEPEMPTFTYSFEGKILKAVDKDGQEKWTYKCKSDGIKIVPEGEYLFVITKKELTLLTPFSGKKRWNYRISDIEKLEMREPRLLILGDRFIAALDINSGHLDWRYGAPEDIESYIIHNDTFVVVRTAKRIAVLDYSQGKKLAIVNLSKTDKYVKSEALGPVLVLHFEDKKRLWNIGRKKELGEIKEKTISDMRDKDLQSALKDMRDKVTSRKEDEKIAGIVALLFMKDKKGDLLIRAGLDAEDETARSAAQKIMQAMAEYSRGGKYLAEAAVSVLEELAATDSSGTIEKAFYTAYFEKYEYELPNPESVLKTLTTMLEFADKNGRGHAINMLKQLTDKTFQYKADGSLKERNAAVKKWGKWLRANQGRFKWDIPGRKIKIYE